MLNFDLFEQLEKTNSRLEKEAIIAKMGEEEKQLLLYALDPYRQFNIKKLPNLASKYLGNDERSLETFLNFLDEMSFKKAATNQDKQRAKDIITQSRFSLNELAPKWLERVLLKDLKCGVEASTVNNVFPGLIPTFGCALADVWMQKPNETDEKYEKRLKKQLNNLPNCIVEAKLDGIRCIANVKDGVVIMLSRNGKPLDNFPQIEEELKLLPNGTYDGEIYVHDKNGFQRLMKHVRTKEKAPDDLPFRYYIFDVVDEKLTTILRKQKLHKILNNPYEGDGNIEWFTNIKNRLAYVEFYYVNSKEILDGLMNSALNDGFEGLMIKDCSAKYEPKRTKNILKLKRFHSSEAIVVGFVEGRDKYQGMLGTIILDKNGITFEVGSGFNDEQRERLWQSKENLIGRIVEYKYQELTEDNIPRFPTFVRFREDQEAGL